MFDWVQMQTVSLSQVNHAINNLNSYANNMNDNDIIQRRDIYRLLSSINTTIIALRSNYNDQFNQLRNVMDNRVRELFDINQYLRDEISRLRDEISRLNNIQEPAPHPPPTPPPPPPLPEYTKEDIIAEILESVDQTKEQMQDQTYRTLTTKLMEIYNR